MALFPQYRFEIYKKTGENTFSLTPTTADYFTDLTYRGGIESTKDLIQVKFPNERVNGSAWSTFLGKTDILDNLFSIDDEIKFYAYYGDAPSNLDDALILSGRIASFKVALANNQPVYTMKIINRTEELLNTMIPFSVGSYVGSNNTSPLAVKQLINRLNQFNSSKNVFAYLDTETNPVTGSPGLIQSQNSGSTAFPTIEYNSTWKPIYYQVEQLSSPEYTGDETAGDYLFYVTYSSVQPSQQAIYGKTINEVVWKSKSLISAGSLIDGENIVNVNVDLDVRDIQNLLIVNAGTDKAGAGITGVAYNLDSVGKFGAKMGYYTRSRRMYSTVAKNEVQLLTAAGSQLDSDGFPSDVSGSVAYPVRMSFQERDSISGSFNGSFLTANNKKEWNQYLRDEARWQAILEANKVLEKLGEPKYNITADLLIGSNNISLGDIYNFVVPSYGWEGTVTNPGYKLRVTDIQHDFNKGGWTTRITAKEDEKVVSEALGNTKNNVGI